jgi:hypothetical protein
VLKEKWKVFILQALNRIDDKIITFSRNNVRPARRGSAVKMIENCFS